MSTANSTCPSQNPATVIVVDAKAEVRFWCLVRSSIDGCWVWKNLKNPNRYATMYIKGHSVSAHRVSWTIHNGKIPEGMLVCHRCDNPRCVRPDHLFLGTDKDNTRDAMTKGRFKPLSPLNGGFGFKGGDGFNQGASNPYAKLAESDVIEIFNRSRAGERRKDIARDFGVSTTTVTDIKLGTRWAHITKGV